LAVGKASALAVLQLQRGLVGLDKLTELIGLVKQPGPLLVVQGDRKSAQAIDADAAFFADLEVESAALTSLELLFRLRQFGFQFLIAWIRHRHLLFLASIVKLVSQICLHPS